ncbi:MAG: mechanosensitive ion channel [Bacteroidales bacterium]|nr:mechanosensitive ion channel [Bacteroidales bacterium]
MKINTVSFAAVLLALFSFACTLTAQDLLSRDKTEEADSSMVQPFPAIDISKELGNSGTLINASLKKQLSPELMDAFTSESDSLLSLFNNFLGDSSTIRLEAAGRRQLDLVTQRARFHLSQLEPFQESLIKVTGELENELSLLENNRQRWQLTLEQPAGDEAVVSREERIQATLRRIDSVRVLLQDDLVSILGIQDRLTEMRVNLQQVLERVRDQKTVLGETLFKRDMPGLFRDLGNLKNRGQIRLHTEKFRQSMRTDLELLKSGYTGSMLTSLLLFSALLAFLIWFRKNYSRLISGGRLELSKEHRIIINAPLASAIFLTSLMVRLLVPDLPDTFNDLNLLVVIFSMTVLMIRIYGARFRLWIVVLVVAASFNTLYELAYHPGILLRILLIAIGLTSIWLFAWVYRRQPFEGLIKNTLLYRFFRTLVAVFLILEFLALIANLAGAFRLAEFFTLLPLQITILAIAIQILTRLADTLIFLILSGNYLQKLNVIRDEFAVIHRKSLWLADLILLLIFLSISLDLLRIKDAVFEWGRGVFTNGFSLGEITISLGNILIFFFVIWLSIMITKMMRHVLEKDVFTRVKTSKGMPGTIVLLLRIALISLGFVLAARVAGMELTNLSIVLGAFSVGIGFGLQNIFNNLVSGLILAFERPINVGDVVQVGELMGTVKSIGLRSSTVHSFDGAEVVVPNGNLISNEMINWTLSDSFRRMDIRAGVAYGTDPERVLAIMTELAANHELVMKDPPPRAYFIEFGDSSLNFRLLAWVHMENRLEVESDLLVGINRRLAEEGIEIPFPQRDLHIRSDATKEPG